MAKLRLFTYKERCIVLCIYTFSFLEGHGDVVYRNLSSIPNLAQS